MTGETALYLAFSTAISYVQLDAKLANLQQHLKHVVTEN